ncbi:MAG: NYN domain-containing protein [Pseudomonadota bacterium]
MSKEKFLLEDCLYEEEKVSIFIDGANLYGAAKSLNLDIDYRRLKQQFARFGRLVRIYYYTAIMDDAEYSPVRPLVDWLDYNGYNLVTKPIREYVDSAGRKKYKGSMDIDLAVDAMLAADYVDHIMIFSGDGDYRCLVEGLQRKGCRVSVISTIVTQPPMIADELRRQADMFIELNDLRSYVERPSNHAGSTRTAPQKNNIVEDLESKIK